MSMIRKYLRGNEDGMSIVGVVIASLIIMLALIPAAALLESTMAVSADNQHRVAAANLATQQMETIRNQIATQGFVNWVTSNGLTGSATSAALAPVTQTVGTIPYTVATNISWSPGNFQSGGCSSVTATAQQAPPLLEVAIKVTWPNQRLSAPVSLVSSLNAPSSLFSTNDGSVLVSVVGAGGATDPQEGVVVDLYPGSASTSLGTPISGSTDATGCYFFPNVTPGTYTVEAADGTVSGVLINGGYLSQASTPTVEQTISVSAGQTAGVQFVYDKGASLAIADSTQAAIGAEFGLLANDGYLTSQGYSALQLAGSGDPTTYGPVFPNSTGYETWLGACPAGQFTPSANYQTQVATSPATTSSITGLQYSMLTATLQETSGTTTATLPAGTAVDIYVWQYPSSTAPQCNSTAAVIPTTTNAEGQVTIDVPMGYFGLAAAYPSDPAPTAPTTSIIDATTPESVGGTITVTPAMTVS